MSSAIPTEKHLVLAENSSYNFRKFCEYYLMYVWQQADWPRMTWDTAALATSLGEVSRAQGRLLGKMEALGFELRSEAHLRSLTQDVVKSSEIEGEHLDVDQVRSSVARRLHLDVAGLVPSDDRVDGIVEVMLDATENFNKNLTENRLYAWHADLFRPSEMRRTRVLVGRWRDDRDGPMRVVSGPLGREKVHYQAPPATQVKGEMGRFLHWYNNDDKTDWLLRAGLAHLWFVTIHPFEDGNGRIARAVADMSLSRSDQNSQRFYSMSSQIRQERRDYYRMLERTQRGGLDVTGWQLWFLSCLNRAIIDADRTLSTVLATARFWERFAQVVLNERQIKVLNKMLDGFEGKMTTSKWARITRCSQDTAHRDILSLIERGALQKDPGGGRSTSYSLTSL